MVAYNRVGLGQMFDHGEPDKLLMAEDDGEVDERVNAAEHLLGSLAAQGGMNGPFSNMLGAMGISAPRLDDEEDGDAPRAREAGAET